MAVTSEGATAIVEVRADESHRTFGMAQDQGVQGVVARLRARAWAK